MMPEGPRNETRKCLVRIAWGGKAFLKVGGGGGKQNLKVKIREENLVLQPFLAFPYKSNKPNVVDSFNLKSADREGGKHTKS